MNACIDCKHFKGVEAEPYNPHSLPLRPNNPECGHPQAVTRDLIYGKALCQNERASNKGCGKAGKLWEPKHKDK